MTARPAVVEPLTAEAIQSGLTTRFVGRDLRIFETVGSTNTVLRQLAAQGAPDGAVVLAEEQTAGRGRLNRTWESRPGVGVYLSILLRPRPPVPRPHVFTFLPAVAVTRALRAVSGLPIFIHWPNDVMLRGGKVAGILAEMRSVDGRPREVVLGIGMNVNHTPADLSPALRDTATSLAIASGRSWSRAAIVRALLVEMEAAWTRLGQDGPGPLVDDWRKLSPSHFGKPVVVAGGSAGEIRGTTRGVDEDGALLLERADGGLERVAFGEMRRVRSA